MIEKTTAYRVGEQVFPTIQEAQKSELLTLLASKPMTITKDQALEVCEIIVAYTDEVVAILTCQPKGKKPRADKGKNHKRRTPETVKVDASP